ncbi:hypothetical protein EON64_05640 [archaeon]|nr:MAG: hypothetical protein EON64_05640 [archaeon]
MLAHIFSQEEYALALAPGFCRFYAHIGVIDALYDAKYLNVTHLTGCSAGALVSAFMATGMDPPQMAERVLAIQRSDIWDVGGIGGLLKGNLFLQKISENLSVKQFQDTKIPLAMTAFDLSRLKTNCIVTGDIAAATRASCTFPGLFQPISIDNRPHIDGGVWDHDGLMSLDACFREKHRRDQPHLSPHQLQALPLRDIVPSNKLIVNVTFDFLGFSKLPPGLEHCRVRAIFYKL